MAGYSKSPLFKKLGIKTGARVALLQAPRGFLTQLSPCPTGVIFKTDLRSKGPFEVILFFARSTRELTGRFSKLAGRLTPSGGLWIAWPKKSSGVSTNLSDATVRRVGLQAGLVDNKVCAVDEVWSGLRFVIRVQDR